MPIFYPPIDVETETPSGKDINYAEHEVLEALDKGLDDKWHVFHRLLWREVNPQGEKVGEMDAIVFHPSYGILVLEVKGGAIRSANGEWFQTNFRTGVEHKLKTPPFQQARKSRYYISDRLKRTALGPEFEKNTAITHTVWFPDITWNGAFPPEVPNGAFILDSRHLLDPVLHIRNILKQSNPHAKPWDTKDTKTLIQLLAPEVNLLMPLGVKLDRIKNRLFRMTESQVQALRSLRQQKRLLVEGCAGSGKTLIAVSLAREHLADGKRVLFTCYNKSLAKVIAADFEGTPGIDVINFHELAKVLCEKAGVPYVVPEATDALTDFFQNKCPELIMDCSAKTATRYDTIIVDEAIDFRDTWWTALEALGSDGFSYYAFYDRCQDLFTEKSEWKPPFDAEPIVLDTNVRNTRPIGRFAARIGNVPEAPYYGVKDGPEPVLLTYSKPEEIPSVLGKLVKDLMGKDKISPDSIVVLSPYKPRHERLNIKEFLIQQEKLFTTDLVTDGQNKVRVGTIQGFKGLEADVVILCGIDGHPPAYKPSNLYVGATRARSMLYVIHEVGIPLRLIMNR